MLIIIFLWLTLILIGLRFNKNMPDTAFTIDNSMALRGICSIEIMIGHLGVATGAPVLFPNRKAGILFVGVFFALSGYGLMYSLANKEDYLTNFFPGRIKKILIPAYIVFVITVILHSIIDQNMRNMINVINIKSFFLYTNWYVWELLMLYIVFYISVRIDRIGKKFHYIILAFSIIFVCVAYELNFENPWYGSTFCFWLGIVYFLYKDKFKEIFVLRHSMIKIISCCSVMAISIVLFFVRGGVVGLLVSRNIASVSFVIMVIILLHWFSLNNSVSIWLGKYSYEIFLFHPLFIDTLRPWIGDDIVYTLLVIGITILASYIYKICWNKMSFLK